MALVHQFGAELVSSPIQVLGINPGPMASQLRAESYHGEDPSIPPNPVFAAEQILNIALGEIKCDRLLIDLSQ